MTDTFDSLGDLEVTVMLADYATVTPDGKVQAIGLGWTNCPPGNPYAVVMFIDVPWTMTNESHRVEVRLYDADGVPVHNEGGEPIGASMDFEMGRPAGVAAGTTLTLPGVLPIGPSLLPVGSYRWEVAIDGNTKANWSRSFRVVTPE